MAMKFTEDQTCKFVDEYTKHLCLYSSRSLPYKSKHARKIALLRISEVMDLPNFGVYEVNAKIKTIRSTYLQEVKQIRERSGQGHVYVSSLKWFKIMDDAVKAAESATGGVAPKADPDNRDVQVKASMQTSVAPEDIYTPSLWYYDRLMFLSEIHEEGREPKLKKPRHNNFTIVKKCCVNLVKKHGRSVTLFDDLAFRELIDLIPMTQSEKQTLTSKYIQSLLDDDQLSDQTDTETMDKTTDDIGAYDDDDNPLQEIKGEIEPIPCTCGKDTDESMRRHTTECPASSQQTYWNFFEVALDNATCQICKKTLTWRDISTLKEHLQNKHPSVDFLDDDEGFRKGPPSEDESTNDFDMEEVYLDEAILENEQTASAAKRRKKRATAPLNITGPITRENIAASLQRFKSLDSFGQYVASLMKLIPKDKCIKFQIQIVERLLQEQAAAG